ncbi:hypothetical protein CEK62_12110 [Alcanivorax sp. N3-2A]|nr:hypothetical protein CEK62_12110 [Alcanivorax sp. N3-2A]
MPVQEARLCGSGLRASSRKPQAASRKEKRRLQPITGDQLWPGVLRVAQGVLGASVLPAIR